MADNLVSFSQLIDEVEVLDDILSDGPGNDSAKFLSEVQKQAEAIRTTAKALTVEDVDAEFTDEEEE